MLSLNSNIFKLVFGCFFMENTSDNEKLSEYRNRIAHSFDSEYFRKNAKLLENLKIPQKIFNEIHVEGFNNVYAMQGRQLVYFSNHVSLSDFLVQAYTFYQKNTDPPRFIAGENLNRFAIGDFFRKCGAIFIQRGKKDRDYWKTYIQYLKKEVLGAGESLLIYPEAGRNTYPDTIRRFQMGTLKHVADIASNGAEIYGMCIHSSYDKIPEARFMSKVTKHKKLRDEYKKQARQKKSLRKKIKKRQAWIHDELYWMYDVLAFATRPFVKDKGDAYLKFGEPFLLNECAGTKGNGGGEKLAQKIRKELIKLGNYK